jgi:hypothetical protein
VITARNWRTHALCFREVQAGRADPSWWDQQPDVRDDQVPESKEERIARHERAIAVCRQCPLQVQAFCKADIKPLVDEGVRIGMVLTPLPAGQPGRRKVSLSA